MKRNLQPNTLAKYKRIVDEWFVNGFNGAKAYRKIYKTVKKDLTASVNFSKIQALPELKAYILEKHHEAAKIVQTTHEGILHELQNWVQSDITETISLSADEIKALPVQIRRLIVKYKTRLKHFYNSKGELLNTEETIELQFVSKERAIDMINKHLGFYEIDNKQKTNEINIFTSNDKHKTIIEDILQGKK